MTGQEEPTSILEPFGWRSLAWAAVVEAAIKTGGHVLNVPTPYSSIYSVLAGQTIEAARIALLKAREYLNSVDVNNPPDDMPETVRPLINEAIMREATIILDDEHKKWLSAVNKVIERNPLGLKAGVKPLHLL